MNSPKNKTDEEFAEELGEEHGDKGAWAKHRQEIIEQYGTDE